jgi:hypothetical protein
MGCSPPLTAQSFFHFCSLFTVAPVMRTCFSGIFLTYQSIQPSISIVFMTVISISFSGTFCLRLSNARKYE